jgi:hypothetical protein
MRILNKKPLVLLLPAVLVSALAVVLTVSLGGANAGQQPEARMTSFHTPTGPEMTPAAATELVVGKAGRRAGVTGPLVVTTVHSDFAKASAVVSGQPASDAVYGGPPDIAEWRTSPVYLVVMEAPVGSKFAPNVSVPPGHEGPTGSVMSLIIDAHTGQTYSVNVASTPPPSLGELGPAFETRVAAESSAAVASATSGNAGLLAGKLYHGNHAVSGWRVFVGHEPLGRKTVAKQMSGPHGLFSFRLAPGYYVVAAWRPSRGYCGQRTVHISRHKETHIAVSCPK